jgi:hypothetical protein
MRRAMKRLAAPLSGDGSSDHNPLRRPFPQRRKIEWSGLLLRGLRASQSHHHHLRQPHSNWQRQLRQRAQR